MKGVILAGGTGSRLFPLTKVTNKHLLPVGRYPMLYHPVAKLAEAGITSQLIITGTEHMGSVVGALGSGHDLGLDFSFRVQDQAGGIAQALGLAEAFVNGDACVVILGDNIFESSIKPVIEHFETQRAGARILLKSVGDPGRFGVAELDGDRVKAIEEKPLRPRSNLAVTGIYLYDSGVFDIIRTLRPSNRGELEITDVNNDYIRRGLMEWDSLEGWWTDAGTHESLARANDLARHVLLPICEESRTHGAGIS